MANLPSGNARRVPQTRSTSTRCPAPAIAPRSPLLPKAAYPLAPTTSRNPHRPQRWPRAPSRVHSDDDCQPAALTPRHPFLDRPTPTVTTPPPSTPSSPSPPAPTTPSPAPDNCTINRRRLRVRALDFAHGPREPGPCVRAVLLRADLTERVDAVQPRHPRHGHLTPVHPILLVPVGCRGQTVVVHLRLHDARPGTPDAGVADFVYLANPATALVTFNSTPSVESNLGTVALAPRNRYVVSTFPCHAYQRISFAVREPAGADTCLYYFADIMPVPFGLYISKC
ncbi:hypothetical protein DL770_009527 [Monosporascus sp. CRB-9-2]|nr:hypothetical protein DL770_009527 [Monosporascus sp. CRB-9-2]